MWDIGDRVLALWPVEDVWWYAATVISLENGEFLVAYDDGDRAWLTTEQMAPLDLQEGMTVFGRWQGEEVFYPGTIAKIRGSALFLEYSDGDSEWTTAANIRIALQAPLEAELQ